MINEEELKYFNIWFILVGSSFVSLLMQIKFLTELNFCFVCKTVWIIQILVVYAFFPSRFNLRVFQREGEFQIIEYHSLHVIDIFKRNESGRNWKILQIISGESFE
mgnify:CR=1 FL=1